MELFGLPTFIVVLGALGVAIFCYATLAAIRADRRRPNEEVADRFITAVRRSKES